VSRRITHTNISQSGKVFKKHNKVGVASFCDRAEIEADLRATAERKTNDLIDTEVRKVLLQTSEADVEKVRHVRLPQWPPQPDW
jgi:hypothetical protein